nr:LysM domain-containing protein [Colletotrichum truncatum]KAF6792870.1 LysM domain-containing protein [Colletotrichum truncatum]
MPPAVGIVSWNSWIASEADCDAGSYAGLGDAEEHSVCTKTSDGPGLITPPGPQQPEIITGCRLFYIAFSGDGCRAIINEYGISFDDLYAWNLL